MSNRKRKGTKGKPGAPRRKLSLETLEPRLLLSADIAFLNEAQQDPLLPSQAEISAEFQTTDLNTPADSTFFDPHAPVDTDLAGHFQQAADTLDSDRKELLIIDSAVPEHESLLDQITPGPGDREDRDLSVFVLDAEQDGLEQISNILSQHRGVFAVHLVSHGDEGALRLGDRVLDSQALDDNEALLQAWGESLSEDGDILLYGCDIAGGEMGLRFVEALAVTTGADIAASTDTTGAERLSGDWTLEHHAGVIESNTLSAQDYDHQLAEIIGTADADELVDNVGEDDTLSGLAGDDAYQFQDGWGNDTVIESLGEGRDTLDFSAVTADLTITINTEGEVTVSDGTNSVRNVANIEKIIGGSGEDKLVGPTVGTTWNLTGDNTGIVDDLSFSGVEELNGSSTAADEFIVGDKTRWSGTIDAGGGDNVLSLASVSENLLFDIRKDETIAVKTAPDAWAALGVIPEEILSLFTDGIRIDSVKNVTKLIGGIKDNRFLFEDQAEFAG